MKFLIALSQNVKPSTFKIDTTGNILVNDKSGIIMYKKDNLDASCLLKSQNVKITILNGKDIWVGDASKGITYILNSGKLTRTLEYVATIPSVQLEQFITKDFIYAKVYIDSNFSVFYYARISKNDYNSFTILRSDYGYNSVRLVVNDFLFISVNKEKIGLFDFQNRMIWECELVILAEAEKAIIHSKILCLNDKLFFVLTGNQNNGLYVLDVHTGELLKKFKGVCYEIFQDGDYIFSSRFENILCRINSKTLEIEEWDCNELIKSNGFDAIHDHRCTALTNKFYFTQTLGDNKAKIGILDWEKQDLVYKHDFEPENGGVGSIQVNESRMFIHTQDNTLHIFDKEE